MNIVQKFLNKKATLVLFLLIFFIAIITFSHKPAVPENDIEIVVDNLSVPWAIDFLPDGTLIFTEREGKVSTFNKKERKMVGEIRVSQRAESGLLGIAVDPNFNQNKFIYLYYTYEKNGFTYNKISRFFLGDKLNEEFVLLDNIPSAQYHDGGRIKFGPDGNLYATIGDATDPSSAQDIHSLAGKILRLHADGRAPIDNPFNNYVYSYGHRNPQGIDWNEFTGELYSAEHGPSRNDEINLIAKGGNYGWPEKCEDPSGRYIQPVRCYTEFTLAPSGIAFYKNELYVGGLRGTQLRRIVFDDNFNKIILEEELFSDIGRIRDVVEHDGYLYITTSN